MNILIGIALISTSAFVYYFSMTLSYCNKMDKSKTFGDYQKYDGLSNLYGKKVLPFLLMASLLWTIISIILVVK